MTELPRQPERIATLGTRPRSVAAQLLGAGLFVSLYVHLAGPTLYGLATSADVGLVAPTRNRASIELTLSLPSRANPASDEAALVRLELERDPVREAERLIEERESPAFDDMAATSTELNRTETSFRVSTLDPTEPEKSLLAIEPPATKTPAPRPLDRRQEEAAPRSAEQVAEAYHPARAATVDSPSQMASAVRLGAESESLPELAFNQPPTYPAEALLQGLEGQTIVSATISRTGTVVATSIAVSSGSPLLDQAAEEAVRTWRFRPALRFGLAVEMKVGVPVTFSIQEARSAERDSPVPVGSGASSADDVQPNPQSDVSRRSGAAR